MVKQSAFATISMAIVVALVVVFMGNAVSHTRAAGMVGDLNNDGTVNTLDLSILLSKWSTADAAADLNHDGLVGVFDLSILLSRWGQSGPTPTPSGSPSPSPQPLGWNMAGSSLQNMVQADNAEATKFFSGANTMITGPFDGTQYQVPSGWSSLPEANFKSYAAFSSYVNSGNIDSRIKWMKYDPENWADTPVNEQQDPYTYSAMFCSLAHSHGWYCNVDPARDLMNVSGAVCTGSGGLDAAYLSCRVAARIGAVSDLLGIQGQADENDPVAYKNFISAAVAQAKGANPAVRAYANLSSTLGGACAMYNAHQAVEGIADGHFLNVSNATSTIAIDFLKNIDAGSCVYQ